MIASTTTRACSRFLDGRTEVKVVALDDETGEFVGGEPAGFTYVLMIEQIQDAIATYDAWHPHRAGHREDHLRAIEHYAEHDAWLNDSD